MDKITFECFKHYYRQLSDVYIGFFSFILLSFILSDVYLAHSSHYQRMFKTNLKATI